MNAITAHRWEQQELEQVSQCPVCGGQPGKALHSDIEDFYFHAASGTWTLVECTSCGCALLSPRPTSASIGLAYASYYTHQSNDSARIDHISGLKQDYVRTRWLKPTGRIADTSLLFPLLQYRSYRTIAGQYFRDLDGHGQGRRLLDVGCGSGDFLSLAQSAGWVVEGVDFDAAAIATARDQGLTVHLGGLENYAGRRDLFDQITLSHLIEHVYDPVALLADCYRLLKPRGRLWLETPNINSYGHRLLGKYWRGLEAPRHLVIFNPASLKTVLKTCGFHDVKSLPWRQLFPYLFEISRAEAKRDGATRTHDRGRMLIKLLVEASNLLMPARREFITLQCFKK